MGDDNLSRKDFTNQREVRWCPGCGDYAILAAIQRILPEIGLPPEKHVFVSGIGCAGRLPYYMNAYGLHTIHGRATAVATGIKAIRDDLSVWVITGDGDALSIGGNHLIHCLRRNVNLNILMFNNEVYGLTKGQYSPTSKKGFMTKTSPEGINHEPTNPLSLALAAGASFVARAVDKDPNHLGEILKQAHAHQGASFVEIYQDCNIFNNGTFDAFAAKPNRPEHTISLEADKPLKFGAEQEWLLNLENDVFQKQPAATKTPYCHDPKNFMSAMRLAQLSFPAYPVPLGVYYQVEKSSFSPQGHHEKSLDDLEALFCSKASW